MRSSRAAFAWVLAMATATAGAGCEGRPRRVEQDATQSSTPVSLDTPSVAELDLTRGVPELVPPTLLGPARQRTHVDLVRSLRTLRESDATKGVLVRLGAARIGFARAHEIGRMLGEIKASGKPIVCHADDYNNGTLLLTAVGCTRVWLSAAGSADAVGLAAQLVFGNRLLNRLHVQAEFLQVGKYKGASEPFTRDGPSPEARETLETALGGLHTAWLDALTKGRTKEGVAAAADDGPFAAEEAKARGLIDEVGFVDEARDEAKRLAGVDALSVRFGAGDGSPPVSRGLLDVLRAVSGSSRGGTPHVAVVRAIGAISMASSGMFGQGDGITERELSRVLNKLTKDESVKAVVLRIDSPGGSALASDLIWKRLMKLRADKPVVVSIGSMAASGGYYLACAGSKIVAEPTSIIGSIGVVSGKFAVGKALEEIGVHTETVAATKDPQKAARAAWLSPFTPWDEPTRARMLASMTAIYDLFLKRIAEGRGVPVEKIAPSAEGRLFGGVLAKERGLIDELGGLDDAIRLAVEMAKLPKDAPIDVIGEAPGLFELLEGGDNAEIARGELAAAAARDAANVVAPAWTRAVPEIGTFLGSAAPLLDGEKTVVALPFVLLVR